MDYRSKHIELKRKEADSQFKKGTKALSTGLLKWSPDHLGASLYFESAAKAYKEIGNDIMAKDALIKYAISSEKTDSLSCAADGFTQAAFLENDPSKSEEMLRKAQELYLIDGKGERGLMNLKQYAKQMMEEYENSDNEDKNKLQRIVNLYKSIHTQVLEKEDYYIFNTDIVDEYMNILMQYDMPHDAIQARYRFIKYLKDNNQNDHQIRRCYLEILLLYMIADEKFKIKQVMEEFFRDVPNAYKYDEYQFAETLQQSLAPGGGSTDQDWPQIQSTLKKPIFGFLNNELIKKSRIIIAQKIEEMQQREIKQIVQQPVESPQNEEEQLNDLLL